MICKFDEYIKEALIYDCIIRNNIISFNNNYYTLEELKDSNIENYRTLVFDNTTVYCYVKKNAYSLTEPVWDWTNLMNDFLDKIAEIKYISTDYFNVDLAINLKYDKYDYYTFTASSILMLKPIEAKDLYKKKIRKDEED